MYLTKRTTYQMGYTLASLSFNLFFLSRKTLTLNIPNLMDNEYPLAYALSRLHLNLQDLSNISLKNKTFRPIFGFT